MEGNLLGEWGWVQGIREGTAAEGERWIAELQLELTCLTDSCPAWWGMEKLIVRCVCFFNVTHVFLFIMCAYIQKYKRNIHRMYKMQADYFCLLGAEGLYRVYLFI